MSEALIRTEGRAGRITLNRPEALNALTWDMIRAIDAALIRWADDATIDLVIIDGAGDRAFCAGGDIAQMYATGMAGNYDYGRQFWQDEYRLNARIAGYAKPIITFLHGFTMGGGVGIGCHASNRVVDESAQIALPECSIGLVPDVGSTLLLAQAPGRLGEYLAVTGDRMGPGDALHCGFADHFIPRANWPGLISTLCETGTTDAISGSTAPDSPLAQAQPLIDRSFSGERFPDIMRAISTTPPDSLQKALDKIARNAPLAMCVTVEFIQQVRMRPTIAHALDLEYRYTSRALAQGDFLEGIRAALIDRDKSPRWKHAGWDSVPDCDILAMTLPLGTDALQLEQTS